MAFVTRCPYCDAIWRLPDRETAERGPVKCPDCHHSFDATRSLLNVPDELFPPPGAAPADPPPAAPTAPTAPTAPEAPRPAPAADAAPGPAPAPRATLTAALGEEPRLGDLSRVRGVTQEGRAEPGSGDRRRPRAARRRGGGILAALLVLALALALAAVLAVVFNQRVQRLWPASAPYFDEVCRRVTCPGFFRRDVSALSVTKTVLRPVDESGNYMLEATIENTSEVAQAVPHLSIELVDEDSQPLSRKTLAPADYLTAGQRDSLPAQAQISLRVSLQTNVTSARCLVRPFYPDAP